MVGEARWQAIVVKIENATGVQNGLEGELDFLLFETPHTLPGDNETLWCLIHKDPAWTDFRVKVSQQRQDEWHAGAIAILVHAIRHPLPQAHRAIVANVNLGIHLPIEGKHKIQRTTARVRRVFSQGQLGAPLAGKGKGDLSNGVAASLIGGKAQGALVRQDGVIVFLIRGGDDPSHHPHNCQYHRQRHAHEFDHKGSGLWTVVEVRDCETE